MWLRWLASFILFVSLPAFLIATPMWSMLASHKTETVDIASNIAVLKGVIQNGPQIIAHVEFGNELSSAIIGTEGSPVLFATLQSRLRDIASQQGLQVNQSSNLPLELLKPGLEKATVKLELAGSASMIAKFIDQIETSNPALFVDKFELRSGEQEGIETQSEVQLFVGVEVWGLIAKAETP